MAAAPRASAARELLAARLAAVDAVLHNQDNREHDLLDCDDYYQFQGGLAATVRDAERAPRRASITTTIRARRSPRVRTLGEEIARVVRGRAANPKWIAGVMRHGYKGAFEIAATVDYLFAFAATTDAVAATIISTQLFDAYLGDEAVRGFIAEAQSRRRCARWRRASARRSTAASGRRAPNSAYDRAVGAHRARSAA